MRLVLSILLGLAATVATADDLIVIKLSTGQHIVAKVSDGKLDVIGIFDTVTVIGSDPIQPPVTTRPTRAVYVYEKDQGTAPPQVVGAMLKLNEQAIVAGSGFVAAEFEEDTVDGDGQVPDQYKVALEAARKAGLPSLVVLSGDKVLRTVKAPKTEADVLEALK